MKIRFIVPFLLSLVVTACGNFPFKVEVPQGNIITQEQLDNLKPGMTKRQVRYLLGSPALNDVFHPQRWDYVQSTGRAGAQRTQKVVTLVFDEDRLAQIEGDAIRTARETPTMAPAGLANAPAL